MDVEVDISEGEGAAEPLAQPPDAHQGSVRSCVIGSVIHGLLRRDLPAEDHSIGSTRILYSYQHVGQ
ncbi:hypothetical protein GCM10009540_88470 [Streptomyces turgidiscabies]